MNSYQAFSPSIKKVRNYNNNNIDMNKDNKIDNRFNIEDKPLML
jgi:hypothetical protein